MRPATHLRTNGTSSGVIHSHSPSTSTSTSSYSSNSYGTDNLASASTALDRVMGLLDGFEVSNFFFYI